VSAPRPVARRRQLVNRLLLVTVLAGLTAGFVGSLLLQRTARDAALGDARDRNRLVATQYAVRLDATVEALLGSLRLASTRRDIAAGGEAAASELRVVLRVTPSFDELVLLDDLGSPVAAAASRFLAELDDYPSRPDLVTLAAGGEHVDVGSAPGDVVELAVPVESPAGNLVGVLLARSRIEVVGAALEESLGPADPVPFLVARTGEVILHRDRSRSTTDRTFPLRDIEAAGGVITLSVEGRRQLYAAAASDGLGATVVVEQPESVALDPVGDRRDEQLVILLAAMAATVAAVAIAGELLLRPLRPLADVVMRIGRGERGVRTGIEGSGEVGVLAGEVDRMASSLDRRDEQIAELQRLSLLVGTMSSQEEVANRIAEGATKLVQARHVEVRTGSPEQPSLVVASAGGIATGAPRLEVPLTSSDGASIGTLVAIRDVEFDPGEASLLAAFGAFAAVALDNARRLGLQRELVDHLQGAVDRRRDLIGTITHEFRTPLTCIEGFTSALLDGWSDYDDDERRDLVTRIGRHSEDLDELVSRFLDFTVSERGGMSASISEVALADAIRHTIDALSPLLADREVAVDVPALHVAADPVLLRRTLTNLISNAVKYSAPGSPVRVRASRRATDALVEVVDHGVGMTTEDADRAFEPFWRGGSTTTRTTRGAGLGLALVAEYVRVMGGTTSVETAPAQGSTFAFTLPLANLRTGSGRGVGGG
jgi:signal transduction histidine kinase/HAMP domain-containing protein